MKRGALRWRARDVSVMLVVLVCATVVIWTWDRTPVSAFLPPESHFLKLQPEEKVEKIPTAENNVTKDSDSLANPFVNKEDSTNTKDTEEEKKKLQEVTGSETNQGKTPTVEEKELEKVEREVVSEPKYHKTQTSEENNKLEEVKHEVAVGEAEATKITHITETNPDPKSKNLATDEERTERLAGKEVGGSISTAHTANQACNYAKGKWVVDNHRPLYSGSHCKQWLASMWACDMLCI